jgi:hypothetical protein
MPRRHPQICFCCRHHRIRAIFEESLRRIRSIRPIDCFILPSAARARRRLPPRWLSLAQYKIQSKSERALPALKERELHTAQTNKYLPATPQLFVSPHSRPKAFVVTGRPKALFGLEIPAFAQSRRPIANQGNIASSKRKNVFSVGFLAVSVPIPHPPSTS